MKFKPHDHRMWAVIGIYGGHEQNIFYNRAEHGLKHHGTKELPDTSTVEWVHRIAYPGRQKRLCKVN